jgi:alkanesulfonate monooxygenase SsuD/methylene tetrahydromethanopterin reductase-like flavin-dependent oxidoreductase (luciferase family)
MRLDVVLDPFGARWDDVLAAAHAADAKGFDGLWTWDHLSGAVHGAPHVLECWTVLSAIATSVPRLEIGPLVLNPANRDAGTLAVMTATLQHVSNGRLLLGIGAGGGPDSPYALEQRALGRPVLHDPDRRRAVEDTIATLRRTWATPGFLTPHPVPPIIVGGFGPRMAELAGRVADGLNVRANADLPRLIAIGRDAHARAGHDPDAFIVAASGDADHRERLAAAGVDRVIVYVAPPYVAAINAIRI